MAAAPQTHEYFAGMTCNGCKTAVTNILSKCEGVTNFSADVASKKVLVTGTFDPKAVLERLSKWGTAAKKEVRYVGPASASA